jgi:hypothetical protein
MANFRRVSVAVSTAMRPQTQFFDGTKKRLLSAKSLVNAIPVADPGKNSAIHHRLKPEGIAVSMLQTTPKRDQCRCE